MAIGIRSAVGIRKIGMVEDIEKFGSELRGEPFLELPAFGDGQIPVAEASVPERVPAHRSKSSGRRRDHHRVALSKTAKGVKRSYRCGIDSTGGRLTSSPETTRLCGREHNRATRSSLSAAT